MIRIVLLLLALAAAWAGPAWAVEEKPHDFENRMCTVNKQNTKIGEKQEEYLLLFVRCKAKKNAFSTWQCKKEKDREGIDMWVCTEQRSEAKVFVYSSDRDLPGGVCGSACR